MDGGFDLALTEYYGNQLQERVQKYIIKNYYGEQPVATSFSINTNKYNQLLIHILTMRTTLIEAYEKGVKNIVIPMFGAVIHKILQN